MERYTISDLLYKLIIKDKNILTVYFHPQSQVGGFGVVVVSSDCTAVRLQRNLPPVLYHVEKSPKINLRQIHKKYLVTTILPTAKSL